MYDYSHRYFVDGPVTEVDVYDGADSKWRNLVIGTGGAGAKNLFAINVPVPTMPASGTPTALSAAQSAPGASDVRWEISSSDADYGELGHVLQPPEAGILQDGTWAIITGNGYDSASKKAQLYVIDARTGARIAVLNTGWGDNGWPNGLGGVKLVRDSNQRIMYAYAGDLYGSLWKFDLSSTTRADWKIAFGNTPLFWAKTSTWGIEPITAAPAVLPHPRGGFMVFVGTGKLFESDDGSSTGEQSLYGVWDPVPLGGNTSSSSGSVGYGYDAATHNTSLVTQTITPLTINGSSGDYFAISNNAVDYGTGTSGGKRGWKIRMTIAPGQRMIYPPQIESGRVLFDTIVPGGAAGSCKATQAQGYTLVLDPFTGAPGRDGPTFDTNRDGQFTTADNASAAVMHFSSIGQRKVVRIPNTSRVRLEGPGVSVTRGTTSDDSSGKAVDLGVRTPDDVSPVNLGDTPIRRQWRQIVTPPSY
jgi:type IV pilus assembly protein PilY1